MPGGTDGRDLARAVKQRRPDLRVIYTSGYPGTIALDDDAFEHGPLLEKPWDIGRLRAMLARVFGPD